LNQYYRKDKQLMIGVIVSILSLGLFLIFYTEFFGVRRMKSHRVLESVKSSFKEDGPIEGSWIEMTAVPYDLHDKDTEVYYGGITKTEAGKIVQYKFIADAYTGEVLNTFKL